MFVNQVVSTLGTSYQPGGNGNNFREMIISTSTFTTKIPFEITMGTSYQVSGNCGNSEKYIAIATHSKNDM